MLTVILGFIGAGFVVAWLVGQVVDEIADGYERRTGRDWTTGKPK